MQTRIQELPGPALAGGLVVLGGVALWQLGVEFERAWLRSYDAPLVGESPSGELLEASSPAEPGEQANGRPAEAAPDQRRWVAPRQPRVAPRLRTS